MLLRQYTSKAHSMPSFSSARVLVVSCLFAAGFFAFPQVLLAQQYAGQAGQHSSNSGTPQDISVDVTALENRYFFHQYQHDPIEKRLERLELLVFGAAQGGLPQDRLVRLKTMIAQRDKQAAQDLATKNKDQKQSQAGKLGGSSQYPVLNTLEWRVLKKTHPTLSLDERLSQLETHLFGQPSVAMSYADRVERLQKTIGLGISRIEPQQSLPQGPLPKAQAGRGLNPGMPFYEASPVPPFGFDGSTPFSGMDSFGYFGKLDDANAAKIQKRMVELLKHFSNSMGVPFDDSAMPNFSMPNMPGIPIIPGGPIMPGVPGSSNAPQGPAPEKGTVPAQPEPPAAEQQIPPYADPNSI